MTQFQQNIQDHAELLSSLSSIEPDVDAAAKAIIESLNSGGCIMLCGNGGSAADAQHIAGEFVGRFLKERRALPSLALHTNTTVMTAIGNDYSFDTVYARQVEAHGKKTDVLIAITTSGNSANILNAAEQAKRQGITVIGLTGGTGGKLKPLCDICICVPSDSTPRIQEMHILIGHTLCQLAEQAIC
ncbi:MAG: SIS domain-containing protein [Fimbriimonadales bacterium]